ncbi:heterokaryon incompatibility domain-containing protein [Trichoderma evansii]
MHSFPYFLCLLHMRSIDCQICETIRLVLCGSRKSGSLGSGIETLRPDPRCNRHQKLVASTMGLDISHPADALPMIIHDIRHLSIHKNPVNMATIITPRMSLEALHATPPVSALYLAGNSAQPEALGIGRLLNSQWIDQDQLGSWKSACASGHSGLCQGFPDAALSSIRPIWLVCSTSYVALSYVWGNQPTLNTTGNNLSRLQKEGSLAEPLATPIARTIRDAMDIVELSSERYLWVDTLCIIQDDDSEKHSEMSKMAMIYVNSSVTILAVQGEHANSGLLGFRGISGPRQLHQSIHAWDDEIKLISTPIGSYTSEVETKNPFWATRGWTFQEQYFSRRSIIFGGDSIRWEYKMKEGVIGCESIDKPQIPSLEHIGLVLKDYNKRNSTLPEDCLHAFEGISLVLSPQMAGRFVSGLPSSLFVVALLWQPIGRIIRSYIGWSGRVQFPDRSGSDFIRPSSDSQQFTHVVTRWLLWKSHRTQNSAGVPIHTSILDSRDRWISGRMGPALGWSKHVVIKPPPWHCEYSGSNGLNLHTHYFTHEAHPEYEFWYPIPVMGQEEAGPSILAPYIPCQSRRAWMFPDKDPWHMWGDYPSLSLRDRDGAWAGILKPHDGLDVSGSTLQRVGEAVELVEIAAGYCWDAEDVWSGIGDVRHPEKPKLGSWYEYYWVIWVEWAEGVAYRKGLGRVYKRCWEEQRGEPFKLLLG